jgi:hypothetical protein
MSVLRNLRGTAIVVALAFLAIACNENGSRAGAAEPQHTGKPVAEKAFGFEDAEVGKTPAGFTAALTGKGPAVAWVVREDKSAADGKKVLVQTSDDGTDHRFPICVLDGLSARDVEVSARFKAISGTVDQAGGLVARYKDKDNYYIVRANALEDNVRLYKVVDGERKQFAGANAKVASGEWHSLKLSIKGNHFQVSYEGKILFEADDDTFKDAGLSGMWTKADSVTAFDQFQVKSYDAK